MSARIRALVGIALAALTTGATYLGTYLATSGTVAHSLRRAVAIDDAAISRWVSRDGKEVRFATLEGTPTPMPWTHRPYRYDIPANAREVPVVAPQRTPLVRDGFNRFTGDGRVKYLNRIRETLRNAGHGDLDARIVLVNWANESGWDRSGYGNNFGNIKSQGSVYARNFDSLVRTKKVFVTVPESVAVQVFADRLASMDGYHVFASPEDYARYWVRLVSRYPGALDALRLGGLEGAKRFGRAIESVGYGYSPSSPEQSAALYEGSFNASTRLAGAARWIR